MTRQGPEVPVHLCHLLEGIELDGIALRAWHDLIPHQLSLKVRCTPFSLDEKVMVLMRVTIT